MVWLQTGLVQADRLYTAKKQLVEAMGLETVQVGLSHQHAFCRTCTPHYGGEGGHLRACCMGSREPSSACFPRV